MDPLTLSLLLGGTALSTAGGMFGRSDALANAAAQARARNESLAKNIGILNGFEDQNQKTFGGNIAHYAPEEQGKLLTDAQTTRGNNNAAAISGPDMSLPIPADASPASRSDLAKRMLAVHEGATARAKATGKLGGYSDAWTTNQLNDAQANRDIGVTNNYAEGRKALIGPEGDLAATGAYQSPSIWGPLLSGAGSIASAAGGARGFGGFGGFSGGGGYDAVGTPIGSFGAMGPR